MLKIFVKKNATPHGMYHYMRRAVGRAVGRTVGWTRTAGRSIHPTAGARRTSTEEEARKVEINRLRYRAKQRGFLELDVVVGEWAEGNLAGKSSSFLRQFAKMLDEENPDLYAWLTGQKEAPERLAKENEAFEELRKHVHKFLDEKSDKKSRTVHGKEWVRGWHDAGQGNQ